MLVGTLRALVLLVASMSLLPLASADSPLPYSGTFRGCSAYYAVQVDAPALCSATVSFDGTLQGGDVACNALACSIRVQGSASGTGVPLGASGPQRTVQLIAYLDGLHGQAGSVGICLGRGTSAASCSGSADLQLARPPAGTCLGLVVRALYSADTVPFPGAFFGPTIAARFSACGTASGVTIAPA